MTSCVCADPCAHSVQDLNRLTCCRNFWDCGIWWFIFLVVCEDEFCDLGPGGGISGMPMTVPSLRHVILLHPHGRGCLGLDDAVPCGWCLFTVHANSALVRTAGGVGPVISSAFTVFLAQPAHPQYANYWAPLTRKRHTMPHSAQPQHTKYWAPRTRKRHQQEHRPQRPTESSDPTQHAEGRTGDRPGPRKGTTTRRNVTRGGGAEGN